MYMWQKIAAEGFKCFLQNLEVHCRVIIYFYFYFFKVDTKIYIKKKNLRKNKLIDFSKVICKLFLTYGCNTIHLFF